MGALFTFLLFFTAFARAELTPNADGMSGCSQPVFQSVEQFAQQTISTAQSAGICESGTFAQSNCQVSGIRFDPSCKGADESMKSQLIASIKEVRGRAGLGCLNQVSGHLAENLLKVFQRNPPYSICCNACTAPGSPAGSTVSQPDGDACGMSTAAVDNGPPVVLAINIGAPRGFGAGGSCARTGAGSITTSPLTSTIFHEMLHAAGVAGCAHHGGGKYKDPETGKIFQDQDRFAGDPVYGCEKTCFGTPSEKNSVSCLACAHGAVDVTGESQATRTSNMSPGDLMTRLRAAESLAADPQTSSRVPKMCRDLWARRGDPGARHLASYENGIKQYMAARDGAIKCLETEHPGLAHTVLEFTSHCGAQVVALDQACKKFADSTGCREGYEMHADAVMKTCRETGEKFRSALSNQLRPYVALDKTNATARVDAALTGFRCTDYFPAQALCPGKFPDSDGTQYTAESCKKMLPPRLQTSHY